MKRMIMLGLPVILIMVLIVLFVYFMPNIKMSFSAGKHTVDAIDLSTHGDRIYFLNTGSADAILIESEGKYALVDGAEDSDNPRNFPELIYDGTEDYVVDAIRKIAGDENGKVVLEFILGTHSHSDHIGGLDTVILDDNITVKTAYIEKYDESKINSHEITAWDNKEVYEQMISACEKRNVPVIHDISEETFSFGNFTMKFCNTAETQSTEPIGENENAIGLLVEKNGVRAFLAADINNLDGDEDRLAKEIGKINLLKVGHHGSKSSSASDFLEATGATYGVICVGTGNSYGHPTDAALGRLDDAGITVYRTDTYGDVVFYTDGVTLSVPD